jgi:hypothetical protein
MYLRPLGNIEDEVRLAFETFDIDLNFFVSSSGNNLQVGSATVLIQYILRCLVMMWDTDNTPNRCFQCAIVYI